MVLEKYASQIEFIENFVDSGAYHFQEYRQAKVLASWIRSHSRFIGYVH